MCGLFILKCKLVAALHNHIVVIHYRAVGERRIFAGMDACAAVEVSEKVKPRADLKDSCKQLVAAEAGPAVAVHYAQRRLMGDKYISSVRYLRIFKRHAAFHDVFHEERNPVEGYAVNGHAGAVEVLTVVRESLD